uniref:CARD- and ANK-containing Inflammasome Adaptor Protein n=1 Tax=Mastacembelus armatus TaxID=205130 RepID=A0A7N8WJ14_9TELE
HFFPHNFYMLLYMLLDDTCVIMSSVINQNHFCDWPSLSHLYQVNVNKYYMAFCILFFFFSVLVENQAKLDATLSDLSALHLAVHSGSGKLDAVTSLLSYKAKGGAKDMDGSIPLHYAAAAGHASVVSALLQSLNNKGIEERNTWRKTPLHVAAEKGHDNVTVLLLEAGAKINATDHSKDTPLHCAVRSGHQEVAAHCSGCVFTVVCVHCCVCALWVVMEFPHFGTNKGILPMSLVV